MLFGFVLFGLGLSLLLLRDRRIAFDRRFGLLPKRIDEDSPYIAMVYVVTPCLICIGGLYVIVGSL